jgi:D-glycero-beta-D-manno-heptose 1-phosphate adenylyltransferase
LVCGDEAGTVGEVVSQQDLILQCRKRKAKGGKIVFVAGRFDFLHPGHIRLLEQAHDYGDVVAVAVWSDSGQAAPSEDAGRLDSVRPPGGIERVFTPAAERAEILAALAAVDYAVEVAPAALAVLLAELAPEVVVEGAEAPSPTPPGRAAAAADIEVVRVPLEPGHSTASIVERVLHLSGSE